MDQQIIEILLLAALAGFLLFRLRNALGTRTGHENPSEYSRGRSVRDDDKRDDDKDDKVVRLPIAKAEADFKDIAAHLDLDDPAAAALKKYRMYEPTFDLREFIDGAGQAYEMIILAFENGDKKTLRQFLAPDVYDGFASAIDTRKSEGLTVDARFIGIHSLNVADSTLNETTREAEISLRVVAEMVTAVRNAAGDIIEGDPTAIRRETDVWTFARKLGDADPNWTLTATGE